MRIDRQLSREVEIFGSGDFADKDPSAERGAADADSVEESQINIKGNARDIQRFRQIAKRDGLRLIGLLRRATEAYERQAAVAHVARQSEMPSLER
jgi:hypothetical protein